MQKLNIIHPHAGDFHLPMPFGRRMFFPFIHFNNLAYIRSSFTLTLNLVQVFPSRSKTLVSILFSFLRLSRKTLILLLMYCAVYAPLASLYWLIITDTAKSHTLTITVPSRLPATPNILTIIWSSLCHLFYLQMLIVCMSVYCSNVCIC